MYITKTENKAFSIHHVKWTVYMIFYDEPSLLILPVYLIRQTELREKWAMWFTSTGRLIIKTVR